MIRSNQDCLTTDTKFCKNRHHPGFTLIELLVVISIIALLIGILLPALSRARNSAELVFCLNNVRSLMSAELHYANDNKSLLPGVQAGISWIGYRNPLDRDGRGSPWNGTIWEYLANAEFTYECPLEKRTTNERFDYTMATVMSGAKLELVWPTFRRVDPSQSSSSPLEHTPMPVIIEEDGTFWNGTYKDGAWANQDQLTDRHLGQGNIAYLDGSAGSFRSPKGSAPEKREPQDFEAWDFIFDAQGLRFSYGQYGKPYAWINQPK